MDRMQIGNPPDGRFNRRQQKQRGQVQNENAFIILAIYCNNGGLRIG